MSSPTRNNNASNWDDSGDDLNTRRFSPTTNYVPPTNQRPRTITTRMSLYTFWRLYSLSAYIQTLLKYRPDRFSTPKHRLRRHQVPLRVESFEYDELKKLFPNNCVQVSFQFFRSFPILNGPDFMYHVKMLLNVLQTNMNNEYSILRSIEDIIRQRIPKTLALAEYLWIDLYGASIYNCWDTLTILKCVYMDKAKCIQPTTDTARDLISIQPKYLIDLCTNLDCDDLILDTVKLVLDSRKPDGLNPDVSGSVLPDMAEKLSLLIHYILTSSVVSEFVKFACKTRLRLVFWRQDNFDFSTWISHQDVTRTLVQHLHTATIAYDTNMEWYQGFCTYCKCSIETDTLFRWDKNTIEAGPGMVVLPCCGSSLHDRPECVLKFLKQKQCTFCSCPYDGFDPSFRDENRCGHEKRMFFIDNHIIENFGNTPVMSLREIFRKPSLDGWPNLTLKSKRKLSKRLHKLNTKPSTFLPTYTSDRTSESIVPCPDNHPTPQCPLLQASTRRRSFPSSRHSTH